MKAGRGLGKSRLALAAVVVALALGGVWAGWQWGWKPYQERVRQKAARRAREQQLDAERRAELARLLAEARAQLTADRLEEAAQGVAEALALDRGNAEALKLRGELEGRVGERKARAAKVDAEMAWERVGGGKVAEGQGLREKLAGAEKQLRVGREAYERGQWGEAFTAYQEALRQCGEIERLERERQGALGAKKRAEDAKSRGASAQAERDAAERWGEAVAAEREAEGAFERGAFAVASNGWVSAAEKYAAAEARAHAVQGDQAATARFTANPLPARLTVTANAPNAEIFDEGGRRLGVAGRAIEVPALQTLALTVRASGYAEKVERLGAMEPGKAYTKSVALEEIRGPVEGRDWKSPSTGMEFVWVPALKMWVGKYEVTNGEYRRWKPDHNSGEYKGYSLNGDRQPVVRVNFDDAKAYADWLTQQDRPYLGGARYRLPTEREFMTYCQCGAGREYPWGNNWPPRSGQAGNYDDEAEIDPWRIEGYRDGHVVACDVEKSWENPWGLFGVGGNVWEVCASDKTQTRLGRGAGRRGSTMIPTTCGARLAATSTARLASTTTGFGWCWCAEGL